MAPPESMKQPILAEYQGCVNAKHFNEGTIEEVLCQDLDTLQSELDKINIPRISMKLQKYVSILKSYVNATSFDYFRFENDLCSLQTKLSEITSQAEKYQSESGIQGLHKYAENLLTKMTESARFIKCYTYIQLQGHKLVVKVVELNIKLLVLQNSHGQLVEYSRTTNYLLFNYLKDLVLWEAEFKALPDPTFLIEVFFREQSRAAKNTLQSLRCRSDESLLYDLKPEHFSSFFEKF